MTWHRDREILVKIPFIVFRLALSSRAKLAIQIWHTYNIALSLELICREIRTPEELLLSKISKYCKLNRKGPRNKQNVFTSRWLLAQKNDQSVNMKSWRVRFFLYCPVENVQFCINSIGHFGWLSGISNLPGFHKNVNSLEVWTKIVHQKSVFDAIKENPNFPTCSRILPIYRQWLLSWTDKVQTAQCSLLHAPTQVAFYFVEFLRALMIKSKTLQACLRWDWY